MKNLLFAVSLFGLVACGDSVNLTPELIGRLAFDHLKGDNFPAYLSAVVVTKAQTQAICPNLVGIDRYFDSGDGSARAQEDSFIECRTNIDFSNATLTNVTVDRLSATLARPECASTLERVNVYVEVNVGGTPHYFTVSDVMLFPVGWRAYRQIKNCGTTNPASP